MRRNAERVFDEYLAASARAGDRQSFERLARRWRPKLLAHAYRLTGDMEAAKDVAQDGWCDITKGLKQLNDTAAFPAWAYRIVTRRAADRVRRTVRDRDGVNAFAAEPRLDAEHTSAMEAKVDAGPLNHALTALPPEQRAVVALHYSEGFSVAEIAVALSVPAGTIKTRLMHARRKLRVALEGEQDNE